MANYCGESNNLSEIAPNLAAFDTAFCYLHTYARQGSNSGPLALSRRPNLANFELCPMVCEFLLHLLEGSAIHVRRIIST